MEAGQRPVRNETNDIPIETIRIGSSTKPRLLSMVITEPEAGRWLPPKKHHPPVTAPAAVVTAGICAEFVEFKACGFAATRL